MLQFKRKCMVLGIIISNDDINDLIKIVTALEEHDILLKGPSRKIKNETKEQRRGFLSMLLRTLGASLLGNLLTGRGLYRIGKGMYRTSQGLKKNNNSISSIDKLRNNGLF